MERKRREGGEDGTRKKMRAGRKSDGGAGKSGRLCYGFPIVLALYRKSGKSLFFASYRKSPARWLRYLVSQKLMGNSGRGEPTRDDSRTVGRMKACSSALPPVLNRKNALGTPGRLGGPWAEFKKACDCVAEQATDATTFRKRGGS